MPAEPKENEIVTIRFRTAKDNVDVVWLCTKDTRYQMKLVERDDTFDYYAVRIPYVSYTHLDVYKRQVPY